MADLKTVFSVVRDVPIDEDGTTYGALIQRRYPEITEFNHIHHAGNSSGVVDGAAALLLASESYMERTGMTPRARIVRQRIWVIVQHHVECAGACSGEGAQKAGLTKDDIDVWEINEAFSVVAERFFVDSILIEKVNINGGAMALGHPIGATGSILVGTALDELERQQGRSPDHHVCCWWYGTRDHHRACLNRN